jgi:RimJ/RimL family protein N-acetyltransferase
MNVSDHSFPQIITGEFVDLRKATLLDASFIVELRTSKGAEYLNQPPHYGLESQIRWQVLRPDTEANYIITDKLGRDVGMISIYDCDWANKVSNVGRLLLKEEFIHAGTPFGLEALKLCYRYVFYVMHFNKIAGTINTRNEKIYALQKYLGMQDEGLFRKHVILRGEPQDLHFLALFAEDFIEYKNKIDHLLSKFR